MDMFQMLIEISINIYVNKNFNFLLRASMISSSTFRFHSANRKLKRSEQILVVPIEIKLQIIKGFVPFVLKLQQRNIGIC